MSIGPAAPGRYDGNLVALRDNVLLGVMGVGEARGDLPHDSLPWVHAHRTAACIVDEVLRDHVVDRIVITRVGQVANAPHELLVRLDDHVGYLWVWWSRSS